MCSMICEAPHPQTLSCHLHFRDTETGVALKYMQLKVQVKYDYTNSVCVHATLLFPEL